MEELEGMNYDHDQNGGDGDAAAAAFGYQIQMMGEEVTRCWGRSLAGALEKEGFLKDFVCVSTTQALNKILTLVKMKISDLNFN